VNAGIVLASIAAALQPQRVPLSMLVDGLTSGEEHSEALDNKWAASLAGNYDKCSSNNLFNAAFQARRVKTMRNRL